MDEKSIIKDNKEVYDLTDELQDENNGNTQDVIVVDGRGYENDSEIKKELYTLVEVINDNKMGERIYEDIFKRLEEIVERIAIRMVPEIAERIIKEEIEKLKRYSESE
jgi:hypothetical protein